MPEICRFYGIMIYLYNRDHNPPHFHAKYGGFEASIKIDDLTLLGGFLPSRALGLVMEWAFSHRQELMRNWDLSQKGKRLRKIRPLK